MRNCHCLQAIYTNELGSPVHRDLIFPLRRVVEDDEFLYIPLCYSCKMLLGMSWSHDEYKDTNDNSPFLPFSTNELVLQGVLHKLLFAETREGFSKTVGYIHDISYFASRGLPKSY